MSVRNTSATTILRSGARGAIAAMAMTGMRRITTTAGVLSETPPEAILKDQVPHLLSKLPPDRRPVLVEGAHIAYGTAGGVLFGLLPKRLRRNRWTGPAYGLLVWGLYGAVLAPAMGLIHAQRREAGDHLALVADHLLYGAVVGASLRPPAD